MGGGGYTVGYRYYAGMHLVLCHGPVDAITKIIVGERVAWTGNNTGDQQIIIDQPELFGGDGREGGVVCNIDVMMGGPTQGKNRYLKKRLGTPNIPGFRGVVSLMLNHARLASMNPYIKPWSVQARRIPSAWYPAKATIGTHEANPAHIIYEILTNTAWGLGYPPADLDNTAFTLAADQLYAESFGLSILWSDQKSANEFIDEILRHIDGLLYVHPRTGLFTLKLVRDDYSIEGLPVLDPANIIGIEDLTRVGWADRANQVVATYHDRKTNKKRSITVQDIATIEMQGGAVIAVTNEYPGIATAALANVVAARDLRKLSAPLVKVNIDVNRAGSVFNIGDVFKLTWPELGIDQLVLRVLHADYGSLQSGKVRLGCVEDIFAMGSALFAEPEDSAWVDPVVEPAPAPHRLITEAPYWTIIRDITGERPSALADLNSEPEAGFLVDIADKPSDAAISYQAWARQGAADYALLASGNPCPTGTLVDAIGHADTSLSLEGTVDVEFVSAGSYAYLEAECIGIDSIVIVEDPETEVVTTTVTVKRGVLDTVPVTHAAGARVYFAERFQALDRVGNYLSGEVVDVKTLPQTGLGTLALTDAPVDSYTFAHRFIRPYPPGALKINTAAWPVVIAGDLAVAWAHRDRTLQTAALNAYTDGNIGPEAGTTYTVTVFDAGGSQLVQVTGITGTSYSYSSSSEAPKHDRLRATVKALRGGYDSWQTPEHTVDRCGYGFRYGEYYGGASGLSFAGWTTIYTYGDSFV